MMRSWVLWASTIVMLLISSVFLVWAVQTAWLSGFPDRDKNQHETWMMLQLAGALAFVVMPLLLWGWRWRRNSKRAIRPNLDC